jgi:hypothetical protein
MDTFIQSLPFVAAISLLIIGVVRLRRFLFIASFPVLIGACLFALAADGSSGAFSFMGGFVLVFGLVCVVLSRRLKPGSFVSRDGLGAVGALFFFLGLAGMMMI